jgi:predicted CXXCH cytochrome family protein
MRRLLAAALAMVAGAQGVRAADPPHSNVAGCAACHITHNAAGASLTTVAGNGNLCMSCHVAGGIADGLPFAPANAALPGPGLPAGIAAAGNSHRWDAGPAGHVSFLGGAATPSTGGVEPFGMFSGPYPKTYTITIRVGGNSGTARFDWSATSPGGGSGADILTGTNAPLDEGVAVRFIDGTNTSFQVNDRWNLYVRPHINMPTNDLIAAHTTDGVAVCSACHDQHLQAFPPFDPSSPTYGGAGTGAGRHFMRMSNDLHQICMECHSAYFVTNAAFGAHPIGVAPRSDGFYQLPASLLTEPGTTNVVCLTCHQMHYAPGTDGRVLRLADTRSVCGECHTLGDTATPAIHLNTADNNTLWPGGQYGTLFPSRTGAADRGSCVNCHATHGWADAANTATNYPWLLVDREENLCFTCHDASPAAKNIRANFAKAYSHPVATYTGRHRAKEGNDPAAYGSGNRHAECADCHNVHAALADPSTPSPPAASLHMIGVGRVSVSNGVGTVTYTYRGPEDPTPIKEHEVCFKCHSGWTSLPSGQSDLGAEFNTNNPSFHPVEGGGRNRNINANAFVNGWTWNRLMYCIDCHTSDDASIRGPHGSAFRYILKKTYTASSARLATQMSSSVLCFDCHSYNTYANPDASDTQQSYSRFNKGSAGFDKGHAFHVGSERYPCYACHETHGSANRPGLMVTGRTPGLNNYTQTATGGSCAPTCHGSETYPINYAR